MEHLTRPIFLLTDFGARDTYVGQVRAVISGIAPGSPVHDLTHEVDPFAIDEGAWLLETLILALPMGAIVMAIVDPGVGSGRRAIAARAAGRWFVGPDNGILSAVIPGPQREGHIAPGMLPLAGTGVDACELTSPQFRRLPASPTFHGRDIFAPAAAHLAIGLDWRQLGEPVRALYALPPFCGVPGAFGCLEGRIIHVDRYGNLVTTIRAHQLFPVFALEAGSRVVDTRVRTFADAPSGVPFCHADSSGFLAIALNQDSAAQHLGLRRGDPVRVLCR